MPAAQAASPWSFPAGLLPTANRPCRESIGIGLSGELQVWSGRCPGFRRTPAATRASLFRLRRRKPRGLAVMLHGFLRVWSVICVNRSSGGTAPGRDQSRRHTRERSGIQLAKAHCLKDYLLQGASPWAVSTSCNRRPGNDGRDRSNVNISAKMRLPWGRREGAVRDEGALPRNGVFGHPRLLGRIPSARDQQEVGSAGLDLKLERETSKAYTVLNTSRRVDRSPNPAEGR